MTRLAILISLLVTSTIARAQNAFDIVVYGGTSSGVVAAVQSGRAGKSVVLIEPSAHVGGITASGLGESDVGKINTIGGMAREFYARIYQHYTSNSAWRHETREEFLARRKGGL